MINEQKRYILLSETVKLLSTNDLKGGKPKENRKIFPASLLGQIARLLT